MRPQMPVLLRFRANVTQYEVTVYDGCDVIRKRVNGNQGCLCLYPRSPCLRIVATPRVTWYSAILYFFVDVTCQKTVSLYLAFPEEATPPLAVNAFTLTDRNYGLPIDGSLLFTSV